MIFLLVIIPVVLTVFLAIAAVLLCASTILSAGKFKSYIKEKYPEQAESYKIDIFSITTDHVKHFDQNDSELQKQINWLAKLSKLFFTVFCFCILSIGLTVLAFLLALVLKNL